jgi:hypothetical protein
MTSPKVKVDSILEFAKLSGSIDRGGVLVADNCR